KRVVRRGIPRRGRSACGHRPVVRLRVRGAAVRHFDAVGQLRAGAKDELMTPAAAPGGWLSRRTFLRTCAVVAATATMPLPLRWRSLDAIASLSFGLSTHERAVLIAAANTVAPGATVQTRTGSMTVPAAGDAGAVD